MADPWDWDVDRVVQEFCTPNRSWKPNKEPPALPPLDELEASLREQETDGFTLLTYTDRDELHRELGFKRLNQKATFANAIEQFRQRSLKYHRHQSDQEDSLDNSPAHGLLTPQAQSATLPGEGNKKRLLAELASFQPLEERQETVEVIASDKTLNLPPGPASAPLTDPIATPLSANEPLQKKRRIAPTTITTKVDVNAVRNIPTAADDILGGSSNASSAPVPIIDPSEAYLGMNAVTRFDIAELGSPIRDGPLTHEDRTFSSVCKNRLPRGRQLQRHRLFKRRLLHKQTPDRLIPTKSDTVFGANDPNRNEVLPYYGESESEYDSETWEEMEAEIDERAAAGTVSTGLDIDQVNSVIDEEIQHLVNHWRDHRLPKLGRSAYKVWSQPRKRGYLRIAIENERQLVHDLEGRLTKYREKILEQQFYKEAEVRLMCRIFEQTVDERETASWKVGVLSSSEEPERPTRVSQAPSKKPRKAQPVGDDGSEILTSESEDDGLGNFVVDVDDDPHPANDGGDSPTSLSEYYSPISGGPTTNGVQNDTMDQHDSTGSSTLVQPSNIRTPGVPSDPHTPSKSQRTQPTIIDLTTPDKRPISDNNSASRRQGSSSTIRIKLPKQESASSQSSSKKLKHKGSSCLIMEIDDLNRNERKTTQQLEILDQKLLSIIFTVAQEMKPESIWKDFIIPALGAPAFPQTLYSDEEMDIVVAFRLLRLFDTWLDEVNHTWTQYKRLNDTEKKKIIENGDKNQGDFGRFIGFINRISDRFEWTKARTRKKNEQGGSSALVTTKHQAAVETISDPDDYGTAEEDINTEVAGTLPSKKKRRKVRRNQEAKHLREIDREQMREQEARRNQLRAQLERLEASGAAMGSQRAMIVNESKDDDEGFIYIHDEIAPRIKEHQVAGVRFMWNQVIAKSGTRQGCLLAHTMGLGKTMQIITLLVTIAEAAYSDDDSISSQIPNHLRESKTLILCPPTLVNNWLDELLSWTPDDHGLGPFYKVDSQMPPQERGPMISRWAEHGGILVIGYSLLKQCTKDESIQLILNTAPNLVVADEAHYMKNPKTQTHIATANFKTKSRIALTGSPLANNVEEYHAMINWVAPNYLSDITEFRQEFARPIADGLSVDSLPVQRRKALSRLHALKTTVDPKVHRLTISTLKNDIPPKTEFVLVVPLTPVQKVAYEMSVGPHQNALQGEVINTTIFATVNILGLLCAHPNCLLKKYLEQKNSGKAKSKDDPESIDGLPPNLVSDQISYLRKTKDIDWLFHSWKIPMLTAILDESRNVCDSVLVFSQSITTLDYLENILRMQKRTVQRLDGSTPMNSRQAMVKDFNKNGAEVFLISTTAGGLGLNITGANRVIIFDFKFNPQQEQQAVGRAYRLGQTKPVFVYRFVCGGTFEETQLSRSIFKMQLADRVIDKKNPIPKASHFGDLFKMPSDPEQKELSGYRGRDTVLDKILDSEELRRGLRSIITMDTFQEESLEDSKLSDEQAFDAAQVLARHKARMNGKYSHTPPTLAREYGVGATSSQSMTGHALAPVAIPSTNRTTHASASTATFSTNHTTQAVPSSLPTQTTNGHTDQPDLEQRLQPTMGASTGIRKAGGATELRASAFKSELRRLFGIDAVAQAIVDAVEGQEGQRSFEEQRDAKWAIVEAAGSSRFVKAVESGVLTPQEIAALDAGGINMQRDRFDAISEEKWREHIGNNSHGADPEVQTPTSSFHP